MASILVCYGTGEGQTRKVARRIAGTLEDRGHTATVVNADDCPPEFDVDDFDAALVGGSIHAGRHQASVRSFVGANRDGLLGRPSGFFQVSRFSAAPDRERQELAKSIADDLFSETGWYPDLLGLFGGAIRYSMYGFVKRQMVRWWARRTTGDTDTSRDYEYTDWNAVERFARDFAEFVDRQLDGASGEVEAGVEGPREEPVAEESPEDARVEEQPA